MFVLTEGRIFCVSEDIFYMTKALLQGDDIDPQLTAIADKFLDLCAGVSVTVAYLRVFLERVGALPFHHQRIDALLAEIPGQGLKGRHSHHLDAKVQMEALDITLRPGSSRHQNKEDQAASWISFHTHP